MKIAVMLDKNFHWIKIFVRAQLSMCLDRLPP